MVDRVIGGWIVYFEDERNKKRHIHVSSIYNGKVTYNLDWIHAKTYKTEKSAKAVEKKIMDGIYK